MASGGQQPAEVKAEVGATDNVAGKRWCICLELGPDIIGGGPVCNDLRVRGVGNDPTHWEGVGRIPPQGGLQDDWEATLVREGRHVEIPPVDYAMENEVLQ